MVKNDLHAALCDFGLSKALSQDIRGFTTTASFKGSIHWCSPEVLNSNMKSPSSDMWAWALLVWEVRHSALAIQFYSDAGIYKIMTGEPPFGTNNNPGYVVLKIMMNETPKITEAQVFAPYPELAALLQRCLDPKPESRPIIGEFLAPLRAIVSASKMPLDARLIPIRSLNSHKVTTARQTRGQPFLSVIFEAYFFDVESKGPGHREHVTDSVETCMYIDPGGPK